MNSTRPTTHRLAVLVCLVLPAASLGLLLGCSMLGGSAPPKPKVAARTTGGDDGVAGRLRSGDQLQIKIDTGVVTGTGADQPLDVSIDEDGYISLTLVGRIKAEGLTASELAERIQANYVPRYYVRCTATVLVAQRFFYVSGEVRSPSRFLWSEDMSLMKAISTASGFTDYANRNKVQLVRGKQPPQVFDCQELQRNPSKDVPVRPGDTITVPRSIF